MKQKSALAAFAICTMVATAAWSQESNSGSASTSSPLPRIDLGAARPFWSAGKPRMFAAVTFDIAGISERTELDVGYGRPHYMWIGAQVESSLALRGLNAFGGITARAPWGFIRLGPRFVTSTNQKLLEVRETYTRAQLDINDGLRSKYLSLDGELGFAIPLPYGSITGLVTAYGIFPTQEGFYVFEDALRVIVDPPFVGRFRLAYLAPIGDPPTFRVGGHAELIYNPGRDYFNVRIGPAVVVALTHHLEALASVAVSLYNKDEIGISGADLGQIGLRYRWATGDLWPEFP